MMGTVLPVMYFKLIKSNDCYGTNKARYSEGGRLLTPTEICGT